ncbi:MAG: hypothetical protein NTZ38_01850, partial [Candidatus Taylorbacteria bacterium]|nr:hypothetical protein [Candidatus Taylorbacteria bacterium]
IPPVEPTKPTKPDDDATDKEKTDYEAAKKQYDEDKAQYDKDLATYTDDQAKYEADAAAQQEAEDKANEEDKLDVPMPPPDKLPDSVKTIYDNVTRDSNYDLIPDTWDGAEPANPADQGYFTKPSTTVPAPAATNSPAPVDTGGNSPSTLKSFVGGVSKDIDKISNKIGSISNSVASTIDSMRCSNTGCLPIPYNQAFLAPSADTLASSNAILAVSTTTFPVYFNFFWPTTSVSNFRLYLSPTMTMGLGMSTCLGPGGSGMCFIGALPAIKIKAICDGIEALFSKVRKGIMAASSFVNNVTSKVSGMIGGGDNSSSPDGASDSNDVKYNGSTGSKNSKMEFDANINIKLPGFPSFFTNWLNAQIDEIYNKLLDLPDFYLILPDFGQLFSSNAMAVSKIGDITGIDDFFKAIQQIPLIQIQGEEVALKIPIISQNQIVKWQRQGELFVKHAQEQIRQIQEFWTCDKGSNERTICDSATLKMTNLITDVQKVMDTLEYYKNLPKQILKYRTALAKYATQIICYMDAVMSMTGGYIKQQGKIIKSWMKAIEDIMNQFKTWKSLLDVAVDYQKSCDQCKNERYGKIGMLFQLLGSAFPDLPVVQIPKWPDFVFDFSKIEMGVKIMWPDIVFKPEPLNLPDLPTISLPKIIPSVSIDLDGLIPRFDIAKYIPPKIDINLPDLPPLPMPTLPSIPRPPKIPKLPEPVFKLATSLKPLFKILCMIKKGLLTFPETTIKAEVEGLT